MSPQSRNHAAAPPLPSGSAFARAILRIEEVFFGVVLIGLVLLGLGPILSRWLSGPDLGWMEPCSRQLVLWVALFGAGAATHDRNHIGIDAVTYFLPVRWRTGVRVGTALVSAAVCLIVGWLSIRFVRSEVEFGAGATAFLFVRQWWLACVLPVGFWLLAVRFLVVAWQDLRSVLPARPGQGDDAA
jgi:TRAP-type C4-dicarboxylate transport system permease small subunit